MSGPEIKYRARCQDCGEYLNAWRGFSDGRVYDYKTDRAGLLCVECDQKPKPPPPPTNKEIMLANIADIQAATEAGELSVIEAFGMALQHMKADVNGDTIERWVRAQRPGQ